MLNARLAVEASEGRELQAFARISAFVTHDVKNSAGLLSLLAENARQFIGDPEFQQELIKGLTQLSEKLRRLLANLKSPEYCANAAANRFCLQHAVAAWLRELERQLPRRVKVQADLGATGHIVANEDQLRSVLHNLLLNGVKATAGEGKITVETAHENGYAKLVVRDSGCGMSEDFLRTRLFKPFQTTKPRGLGIGLYQCRQIVEAAGGSMRVESAEGRGTTVIVVLPAVGVPAHAVMEPRSPAGLARAC